MSAQHEQICSYLAAEADRLGTAITAGQASLTARFLALLSRWSERIRLTATPDIEQLARRHVPDALMLARLLGEMAGGRCADIGAGNGLPGIVLAILRPELDLTLVEPRQRRVAFLRTAVHELLLACQVVEARVEDLQQGAFDAAWARATFPAPRWMEIGARVVRDGGRVVVFAAARAPEEAVSMLAEERRLRYALEDGTPRCLVSFRRMPS